MFGIYPTVHEYTVKLTSCYNEINLHFSFLLQIRICITLLLGYVRQL